ncbi:DUF883 family protein [Cupriavidus plantarum]|uniref:DUF883 family protein n=1 Tax=Cupriavidus plantarum TaxID=942865 RepID=UPI000E27AEF3|nr:DUF883 family protein [Cupriavidus plantarum]REE85243.1 ElaB/YqjD/DUF883 family membrane-anchored ribosome-binding protein [Cupriavidus plantarum]RLK28535.1 ElaB/YqjD/DUF883 family membrane-anchored ribosome-binding protein [Cupriavidus plantarum]
MDPNNLDPQDSASNSTSQLRAKGDQLARDLDDLISQLPSLTGEAVDAAKQKFLAKAERGSNALQSLTANACERMEHAQECAKDYVHREPVRALGMAAGIGFLLGALLCRPHYRD